jgi:tRNA threonylcarbamoyladenosine biosynthesis protein TsaE
LVNVYPGGRLTLFHLDLYRLDTLDQIIAAGLEEYSHPAGVAVIEWAERWFGKPLSLESDAGNFRGPIQCLESELSSPRGRFRSVHIDPLSETERRITYEDPGA